MNLQHLEEQVTAAEERALQLSLTGFSRLEMGELVETWQNVDTISTQLKAHSCAKSMQLNLRLESVKADLGSIELRVATRGKDSLPPVAA